MGGVALNVGFFFDIWVAVAATETPVAGSRAGDIDNLLSELIAIDVSLTPLSSWGILAEEEHARGSRYDQDEGHDEGDSPRDIGLQALVETKTYTTISAINWK